ncbi:MAG TPA: hypothetical protein VJR48_16485, partial [Ktedonobacterales bacterium]|nr:hypothetical protein [Ktedonobacterales bacterium]
MGSRPDKVGAEYPDPLDQGNLDALIAGRHGAPFDVLGSHVVTVGKSRLWVVRVFRPYADAVSVIPDATDATDARWDDETPRWPESLPMTLRHEAGLFSLVQPLADQEQPPAYRLSIHFTSGVTLETSDPYSLLPVLSEYDLYLLGEGTDLKLYDKLGAHP